MVPSKLNQRLASTTLRRAAIAACAVLAATTAHAADLCNNTNPAAVNNNPASHSTPCHLSAPAHITQLVTYHWNDGHGTTPGTIRFFDPSTSTQYGPFPATGSPGQGGVPNVNWTANVSLAVPAGDYQVIDSDFATWSWNAGSHNNGFAIVRGDYAVALNETHFHCYAVKPSDFKQRNVSLRDQFETAPQVNVIVPVMLCAPVQKNEEPVKDMATHLVCYRIEGAKPAGKKVSVTNQFGSQVLEVTDSQLLCVPTMKKADSGISLSNSCPSGPNAKGQPLGSLHCPCNYPVGWGAPNVNATNPGLKNWWADCKPPLHCLGDHPGSNPFGDSSCQ